MEKSLIILCLIILFSACSKKSDSPTPTPQKTVFNPINCKGLSVKDYFSIGSKWTRTLADTTIHYTIPTIYTINSDSTFAEAYSNGYIYLYKLHTYKELDCLKFTSAEGIILQNTSLKTFIKFIDKDRVYLYPEGTDTTKVDFSKQDFYKRTK